MSMIDTAKRLVLIASVAAALTAVVPLRVMAQDMQGQGDDDDPQDAADLQATRDAGNAYYSRIAPQLAASGRPRELAFAAVLLEVATAPDTQAGDPRTDDGAPSQAISTDPRIATWRAQAGARAGRDVPANELLSVAGADARIRTAALVRWKQAEPDNLAPILRGGATGDALLASTRAATRQDTHFYELTRWLRGALLAYSPTADERDALTDGQDVAAAEFATATASSLVPLIAPPPYKALADACKTTSGNPARAADCGQVADVMRRSSDTMGGVLVGFGIAGALPADDATKARLALERRAIDWRMQQWGQVASRQPRGGMGEYTQLLGDPALVSESRLVDRVLTQAGVPLDPPANWQAPRRRN